MEIGAKHIEHPILDVFAVMLVVVLFAGTGIWYRSFMVAQTARTNQERLQKLNKERVETFEKLMEQRASYLALNAQADGTLAQVKNKIADSAAAEAQWDEEWAAKKSAYDSEVAAVKSHNADEDAKFKADPRYQTRDYWGYPAYPSPPPQISVEFSTEISALTVQETALKEYVKALKAKSSQYGDEVIMPMYNDLEVSAEATLEAVGRDIEILGEIVKSAEQGTVVNAAKTDLMKYNAGDNGIKAFNKKAVGFIEDAGLDLADYDLPGGTDANPSDKSNLK